MTKLTRVLVFIASPGDVSVARECVRHAVERINRLCGKEAGFLLEAIGWEDIAPGKADRSQEVINPYVDAAHIFIGILHQRFGQPTGIAESGTEEEFARVDHRWQNPDDKPAICMFFKEVPPDRLADPGPQLRKVLDFRERIKSTHLYREFPDETTLEEDIENALADWIHKNKGLNIPATSDALLTQLDTGDLEALAALTTLGPAIAADIVAATKRSEEAVLSSLDRLCRHNLVDEPKSDGAYALSGSTEAFVSIAKFMLSDRYYDNFLSSRYFVTMLESRLAAIITNRYHCDLDEEQLRLVRIVLKVSPSAAAFVLYGDTSRFDKLADQLIPIT